ncbi:hypothetical protein BJ138DRAFT_936533 [Hygrophoropsis aurantiaca]|uniref:Uncharacterized protein n=1 Tax=Hygrophoropsis aurantiaca TaxID=72124 RepID=A0ACB8ADD5_9AGAM|nr:hypothetical protein BJ138DRAFT_936533 [Hygrophoropsis aurantiaca]
MHVGLIILHLCLVVVAIRHTEHRATIPISSNDAVWTTALSASLQAFYTIYAALLVYTTQALALSQMLLTYQPLTATHDAVRAWSGLGTAFDSLWQQRKITSIPFKVLCVTLYLISISALHIASSSIIQFQNFNSTQTISVDTKLAWPDNSWFTIAEYQTYSSASTSMWNDITSAAPFVSGISGISTAGLDGFTVYDVLVPNDGTGNATVNATTVHVQCGLVAGGLYNTTTNTIYFPQASLPSGFSQPSTPYKDQVIYFGAPPGIAMFMVTTAINASSSLLENAALTMLWDHFVSYTNTSVVSSPLTVYLVACNSSISQANAVVDVQTNTLLDLEASEPSFSSEWPTVDPDAILSPGQVPANESWISYPFSYAPTSSIQISAANCTGEGCTLSYTLNVAETYLMQLIGLNATQINPYLGANGNGSIPSYGSDLSPSYTLSVNHLEKEMSRLLATMIWTAGLLGNSSGGFDRATNSVEISKFALQMRLNINWVPLSVALGTSVILLALAIMMISTGFKTDKKHNHVSVTNTGVLELIWLASRSPELREGVGEVLDPTSDNLRAAGMLGVRLADVDREYHQQNSWKSATDLSTDGTYLDPKHMKSSQELERMDPVKESDFCTPT